jgi:pilus assembly protein Flp/PilA
VLALFRRVATDDSGQDLVEYALLLALISLICILGLQNLGTAINNTYNTVSTSLVQAIGGS